MVKIYFSLVTDKYSLQKKVLLSSFKNSHVFFYPQAAEARFIL